jgi:hypothetical protein
MSPASPRSTRTSPSDLTDLEKLDVPSGRRKRLIEAMANSEPVAPEQVETAPDPDDAPQGRHCAFKPREIILSRTAWLSDRPKAS